jgi:hypothetical protein
LVCRPLVREFEQLQELLRQEFVGLAGQESQLRVLVEQVARAVFVLVEVFD